MQVLNRAVIASVFQSMLLLLPSAPAASLKLKPITPILDSSNISHTPASMPDYTEQNLPPPSPVPQGDQEKTLLRKAISQYQSGNIQGAEKTFNQVLKINPGNSDAQFSLGAIAEGRGDLSGADKHYRQALHASPDDVEIQQAIQSVDEKIKESKAAGEQQHANELKAAREERLHSQLKRLSDEAAIAYRHGNYDLAISNLEQVARQDSVDPDVQYALAQAYRGKGDLDLARYHIGQAIAAEPNNQMYLAVKNSLDQEAASPGNLPGGNGSAYNNQSGNPILANNNGSAPGQITPIQPETNPPRTRNEYGYSSAGPGFNVSYGGLLPGVLGAGLGYGLGYHRGRSSTRLTRVVEGSLAGAAAGAAMSAMFHHYPGSVRRGAMRGALFGGLAGLIFGGF